MKKVIVLLLLVVLGAFSCYVTFKNAPKKSIRDIALDNIEALAQNPNEFIPHEKCIEKVIPGNSGIHFYECKKGTTDNLFGPCPEKLKQGIATGNWYHCRKE